MVGNRIEEVRALKREDVEDVLLAVRGVSEEGRDAPTPRRPRADDVVSHADKLAMVIEPGRDLLVDQRTGEIHQHVVLTGIDRLDRLAGSFRGGRGRNEHVGVQLAAEGV